MIVNFGKETAEAILDLGYTDNDIEWIGTSKYLIPPKEFWAVADNTTYDNGYGLEEIPMDLRIYFSDGSWLERREYDGSEWWKYQYHPRKPKLVRHLCCDTFKSNNYCGSLDGYCK